MATLQVTAWQLWGTQLKSGSMEHNKDADAPVPDRRIASNRWRSRHFPASPRFAPGFCNSHAGPSVPTITTHYGQFAALRGKVADGPAGVLLPPTIDNDQRDICGVGAAAYYLIAISTFAREARPHLTDAGIGERATPLAQRRPLDSTRQPDRFTGLYAGCSPDVPQVSPADQLARMPCRGVKTSAATRSLPRSRARAIAATGYDKARLHQPGFFHSAACGDVTLTWRPCRTGFRTACRLLAPGLNRARRAWLLPRQSFHRSS
jgi:hypothetical protein